MSLTLHSILAAEATNSGPVNYLKNPVQAYCGLGSKFSNAWI